MASDSSQLGRILWLASLPSSPPPEVIAWSGQPPKSAYFPAENAGFELIEVNSLRSLQLILDQPYLTTQIAFIPNLQPWHIAALLLYRNSLPFVIYYQNKWPDQFSYPKRIATWFALKSSRLILLQDKIGIEQFSSILGDSKIVFFPWYVDDSFFDPSLCSKNDVSTEPLLFVPGDRNRLDSVVLEIAQRTNLKILRVSRHISADVIQQFNEYPNIEVRHFIPWHELRHFYNISSVVLNVVDDRDTSAGMTTFLESLAMNASVITPSGHSCAGYQFDNGFRPYSTIADPYDANEWIDAIQKILTKPKLWHSGYTPRDLFMSFSSTQSCTNRWIKIFNLVTKV